MERSEKRFIEYMDHKDIPHVYLEQSLKFQSKALIENDIKRPDFMVAFKIGNSIRINPIYVDTKEQSFNEKFQTFTFEIEETRRLKKWQTVFNTHIWYAVAIKNFGYKTWFWVSLNDVIEKHFDKRRNRETGKEFYVIRVEHCINIGWNDSLNKLIY